LRGTPLDVFGYSDERLMERDLLSEFILILELGQMADVLRASNVEKVVEFLSYPMDIRGYGHVKSRNKEKVYANKEIIKQTVINGNKITHAVAAE